MSKLISAGNGKHGLRYREHDTRTTGAGRSKRPLRYYSAVYKLNGRTYTDAYGWEDEFKGGLHEIEAISLQLKMNRKAKTPPFSYKDMIQGREQQLKETEQAEQEELDRLKLIERTKFSKMFQEYCDANNNKISLRDEKSYYKNWIDPFIGDKLLGEIKLLDLERIRKKMEKAGRAPRSIGYIKSIVRQVFNYAIEHELYNKALPTQHFLKKQKLNNSRMRYLTPEEVNELLNEIKKDSISTYRISLISMHTGMRFGEIAAMLWQHINLKDGFISVLNPKNNEARTVYMNDTVRAMFEDMKKDEPDSLVFPPKKHSKSPKMTSISNTFSRAVETLGLNDGITDRRMKVVFHTLRHSCASWLANAGEELQVIGKILGQKSFSMTMRYSHINDSSVKGAMKLLDQQAKEKEEKIIPLPQ